MRTYISHLTFAALTLTFMNVACVRSPGGTTKVKFRLPPKSAFKLTDRVNAKAVSQVSDFNCLAVMVTSDPVYNPNTCKTSDLTTFKTEKPLGPYTFLHNNSQDVSIVVSRNKEVQIRVIGFTNPNGFCRSLDDVNDPHVLATSPPIKYSTVDAVLELTMAFDANKKIEECEGADFPKGGDSGPYLRVEGLYNFEGGENPSAKPLTRGACYEVSFMTYEPCNGGVCSIYTPASDVVINFANNDVKFYSSKTLCESKGAVLSSRTMTGGVSPGDHATPAYKAFMRIPLEKVNVTGTTFANEIVLSPGAEVQFNQPQHSTFVVGKPVIHFSGLAPAAGVPLTVAELGPGGCAATTTTVTAYQAGTTAFPSPNVLNSHENFELGTAGLKLLSGCPGSEINLPNSSASVAGYLSQAALGDLGVGGGVVNTAVRLNATPSAGKYLLGGTFSALSLFPSYSVARVLPDGQYDPTFRAPSINGSVFSILELPGGSILLGGDFTIVGGQTHRGLVRLFADGSLDDTFHVDVGASGESVDTLAMNGSTVFVGGSFSELKGLSRSNLASFQISTQAVDGWTPDPNGPVLALLVNSGMGALFVGGGFQNISGSPRAYLASYVLSPLALSGWDPSADTYVFSLNNGVGQEILVGGNFTNIAGVGRLKTAVFAGPNASPTLGTDLSGTAINGNVYAIKHIGPYYYVGGDLTNPASNSLFRFHDSTGNWDSTYLPYVGGGDVRTILEDGAGLLLFGEISQIAGTHSKGFGTVGIGGSRVPALMNPNKSTLFLDPKLFNVINPLSTTGH